MHPSSQPHAVWPVFVSSQRKLCLSARFAWKTLAFLAISVAFSGSRLALAQSDQLSPSSTQGLAGSAPKEGVPAPSVPTSIWMAATAAPTGVSRYAFAQNGEDMYVISGILNGNVVTTVRRYNATTNAWTSLADTPIGGSEAPAGAFYGGKIYVAGGSLFRIYNIATNTWSVGPPRPGVCSSIGSAAGAFDGKVYVVGG